MSHTAAEWEALQQARARLTERRDATAAALTAESVARAALAAARAAYPEGSVEVERASATQKDSAAELGIAREQERKARGGVVAALGAWLAPSVAQDVALLESRYPIVLMPVRIETRFDQKQPELLVRIYPDSIASDSHEAWLTTAERDDGDAYWKAATTRAEAALAWGRLLGRYSAMRAAWIVRETDPATGPSANVAAGSWTRAPEARLLPDRWIVIGYRKGVEVVREESLPVVEPLALGLNPAPDEAEAVVIGDQGLSVDPDVAWAYDFGLAEKAGMGLRVPLKQQDLDEGFDELIAVGVKASLDAATSASRLGGLLDAHHFTRGLEFVPQGTPTNNTSRTGSGFPPEDPGGARSFEIERGPGFTKGQSDGPLLLRAMGLAAADLDTHIGGSGGAAGGTEQEVAGAMNEALWPATLGYFLDQLMAPVFGRDAIEEARQYFIQHVRGRGPYPAFRVGRTPYGLLPVTSLSRWSPPIAGSDLLLILMSQTGGATILGRGFDPTSGSVREWLAPKELPIGFDASVASAGLVAVDLDEDGLPELLAAQIAGSGRRARLSYSVGRVDSQSGVVAWSRPLPIPVPWPAPVIAVSLAAGDLNEDGRAELAVLALVADVSGLRAFAAVGRGLDQGGAVRDGWTDPVEIPIPADWQAEAGRLDRLGRVPVGTDVRLAMALSQEPGGRRAELVVAFGSPVGLSDIIVTAGSGLDGDLLIDRWEAPASIRMPLGRGETLDGIAFADIGGDGIIDLVLLSSSARSAGGAFRIGRALDARAGIVDSWSDPAPIQRPGPATVIGLALTKGRSWPVTMGDRLASYLRFARKSWLQSAADVPHIGAGSDVDNELLETLGMDASTREVWIRTALGRDVVWNLQRYLGAQYFGITSANWPSLVQQQQDVTNHILKGLGPPAWDTATDTPAWDPRIAGFLHNDWAARFRHSLVAIWDGAVEIPLSERDPLPDDYIGWLLGATIAQLRSGMPGMVGERPPLLYLALKHAALRHMASVGLDLLIGAGLATEEERREHELVGLHVAASPFPVLRRSIWEVLDDTLTSVSGTPTVRSHLEALWGSSGAPPADSPFASHRAALERLARTPTAELQRLFGETLDVTSHRLDAWITSLASSRLDNMRDREARGSHLGAFGFVEGLKPRAADSFEERTLDDGRVAIVEKDGGGYVHAPSMNHAATAAILRNAHRTHSTTPGGRYAVDLSSGRVRRARSLLESVRAGQPVGAVLGYGLERGLHERSQRAPTGPAFESFIGGLRGAFPLVADKADAAGSGAAPDTIASRNVVDGLAFRKAWPSIDWNAVAPGATSSTLQALQTALGDSVVAIDETLDAMADLLLAESVFQLVRGNMAGAAAVADAGAQGVRAPEPEIAQASRTGIPLTHRIALVLGEKPLAVGGAWPVAGTVRAACDAYVDGWAGSILPDPADVRCMVHVSYPDPSDPNASVPLETDVEVSLADLNVRPIDVLALAHAPNDVAGASELDRRVAYEALKTVTTKGSATITYTRIPKWGQEIRTFPEVVEIARTANSVLGRARPLRPEDLVPPETGVDATGSGWQGDDALTRARTAKSALDKATNQLEGSATQARSTGSGASAIRSSLRSASLFGLPNSVPASAATDDSDVLDELLAQADSAVREGRRRLTDAAAVDKALLDELAALRRADPQADVPDLTKVKTAADIAAAVFGRGFMLVPTFIPPSTAELGQALSVAPDLVGKTADDRANAISKWVQGVARVRVPLQDWRTLSMYSRAAGAPLAEPVVVQLPAVPGERWVALPFDGQPPGAGRVSVVAYRSAQPAATDAWAGLLIDEWTEVIPRTSELTAITYSYDAPAAEAPQAVLIAVPPTDAPNWDLPTLIDIVRETLDLARLRAVDGQVLGPVGQVLPAIYLASNRIGDAVGVDFTNLRIGT